MGTARRTNEDAYIAGFMAALRGIMDTTEIFSAHQKTKILVSASLTAQMSYEVWSKEYDRKPRESRTNKTPTRTPQRSDNRRRSKSQSETEDSPTPGTE